MAACRSKIPERGGNAGRPYLFSQNKTERSSPLPTFLLQFRLILR
jgi:hypothetical protein